MEKNFSSYFTISFFVLINLLSLLSFWLDFQVGLLFSFVAFLFLFFNFKKFILVLFSNSSLFFLIYITIQILSVINYVLIDYSRNVIFLHPTLLIQGIVYIIAPQLLFYYLGYTDNFKKSYFTDKKISQITIVFLFVYIFGIYLHFVRPAYFVNFQEEVFLSDPNTGYLSFYPKLTIYWNSMIVGVLGVALFWANMFAQNRKLGLRIFISIVFLFAIIFSTQRGAWASLLITTLFTFLFFTKVIDSIKYFFIILITILLILFVLTKYNLDLSNPVFIDLLNRFDAFENAFDERSNQYDNFLYIISKYPFGLGLGLLTHKASDLNLTLTTPDGNYYRIFGELGFIGFFSFLFLILKSLYFSFKKRFKLYFIILSVY